MDEREAVRNAAPGTAALPQPVLQKLDGDHLAASLGEAIRLSTLGPDGWPHAAQLSVGEMLAVGPAELLVAIWPQSNTARNLQRDGRLTLSLAHDGALLEIRGRASVAAEHQTALDLTVFRVAIEAVDEHRAKYAEVLSGVTFRLHEPERVLARWREQIAMLRGFA
ncbi:pyridoxamine 5'-phosphate oxidase family protein [Paraburkholderia sp. B3]|uniref:pyridoxamine 5'-phosphate oxidase family protein n=1 Tax=Paraburkholderia sp. B3 TaxID=3134791 RepID=UPI00398288D9